MVDIEFKVCCVTVLETIVVSITRVVLDNTEVSTKRAVLVTEACVVAAASAEDVEEGGLARAVGPWDV